MVHASADLAPLFLIPRLRQQQPLLHSLPTNSSSNSAADFIPSPLSIHLKHLIERRRAVKRSKHHPQPLPVPPLPASAPPRSVACGIPPLPQTAGVAAAAVGQQQLHQQQLDQLQDTQLLQLTGGPPPEGLGVAGRDVVSLSCDPAEADAVSPSFADAASIEAVAAAALARWQEATAAAATTGSAAAAAAAERDDRPFWQGLCDRIFYSRDLLPVSSLAALLRLICCRYTPTIAAAAPFFLQHFAPPQQQQQMESSTQQQQQQRPLHQQRLPSQRPVPASLLLPLTREFIDDVHCLSAAAAADLAAVFAVSNCCSIELLQLLVRRSIDTWLLPEQQLEQQRQQLQQQQQQLQQLFAIQPEAVSCFSPQEFAVFCSALHHLLQQAQPVHEKRAQQQQQETLLHLLSLPEFLSSAAAFLLRCSPQKNCLQQQAALGSLAGLAADALQQQQRHQQQQHEQLLQLGKASIELLKAADAFIPWKDEAAAAAAASFSSAASTSASTAAHSAKETARLMSLISKTFAGGPSQLQRQEATEQQQELQHEEGQKENPNESLNGGENRAKGTRADEALQQQPGAAALQFLLQYTRDQLLRLQSLLQQKQQQQERDQPPAKSAATAASAATGAVTDRLQYVLLNPWEVPTAETLQLMASVAAATAAAATVLLQPLLVERSRKNAQHSLQQRYQQLLLQLLRAIGVGAVDAAAPAAPLLQATAERLMACVGLIMSAAGASLLPAATDACRALLLLHLLPSDEQKLQRPAAMKASAEVVGWRGPAAAAVLHLCCLFAYKTMLCACITFHSWHAPPRGLCS